MQRIFLAVSLAVVGSALSSAAAPVLQFVHINSGLASTLLAATCDNNNTLVAVGTNSTVLTAKFGSSQLQWSTHTVPISISLLSATYGNNIFLAGGTGGKVVSSTDGLTWGSPTAPFTNLTPYIMGLAFNARNTSNPNFVAAPSFFEVAYSPGTPPLAWKGATMNQYSLIESWRAAAPFGQNSFAVCGFQGDIRSSTDGGPTWNLSRIPNSSFPDLLGIGSDGTNRLVAAGASGALLFSANGTASWSSLSSPAGATALNAVAFDIADGLFIIVGNSGVILTSPDGQTWTQRSAGTGQNFHGVTFGRTGNLAGVGLLVGEGGTAYLAGTSPQTPINPVSQMNCAGAVPNKVLQVTIVNDVAHPAGTVGVDWYNSANTRVAVNTSTFTPTNNFATGNFASNYVFFAQARDLRTGLTSSRVSATLTINPRPTVSLTVSGPAAICNGSSTTLGAALTGLGPWTLTLLSNGAPILVTNLNGRVTNFLIAPVNPAPNNATQVVYTVSSLVDNGAPTLCSAFAQDITNNAVVTINPRPTASLTVSGPAAICNGSSTTLRAALTGLGPWTLTVASNTIPFLTTNFSGIVSDFVVTPVDASQNSATQAVYTVSSLVDNGAPTLCPAGPQDITNNAVVAINPRPTASLTVSGQPAICNGSSTSLRVALTGLGPWTLVLASNTTPFLTTNLSGNVSNFLVSPINASQNNATQVVYTVASLVDNGAPTTCPAGPLDITNNAVVTINPRPTASLTVSGQPAICNGSSTSLRVVLTGLGPWTLVLASNTTPFLTTNLSGNVSNFVVSPINASQNNATQVVYTVASLVDNGAPTTCPAGPLDITNNAVVTINPRPTASLTVSGQPAICNGSSTSLRVALTGLGPWTLVLASNTTPFLTTNLSGNVSNFLVSPINASQNNATQVVYTVASLVDNRAPTTCPAGPLDITNNAVVTINPRPTASLTVGGQAAICNGSSTSLRMALTGLGPWTLVLASNTTPFLTTNLSGNVSNFLVSPINASQNNATQVVYTVASLVDNGAPTTCPAGPQDITNNAVVTINPRPTASLTVGGQAAICNGSSTSLRVALTGLGPWTLVLASNTTPFLTTNLSGNVSNFLVRPINASQNNATQVVYAVASLVDNGAPTTCPAGPQDITNNAVVTINPRPTVSLTVSGQPAICNGSSTSLRVALTGLGPWTLILASNTTPFLTTNLSGNVSNVLVTPLNASPNSPTQVLYTVASLVDNGALTTCPAGPQDITNNAVVTINPRPTASLTVSGPATICNGNSTTLRVALTGLGPWTLTLASNTIPFLTTNLSGNVSNFLVTPVNASQISSTQVVYTVSSLVDNGAPTACPAGLLDFTNNATVTVNPTPAEPTNPVNQIGCAGLTNAPLSVNVLPGHSALWYTVATGGSSIFTGSSYNPTNAIEGTNRFYVASFDNATGCESTNRVEADLILQSCTNQLSITLAGTNVLVTWYGNYVLQNSTNLAPAYWMYVTQGLGGIMNTSIIPALPPPTNNFFRLYAPTN